MPQGPFDLGRVDTRGGACEGLDTSQSLPALAQAQPAHRHRICAVPCPVLRARQSTSL